MDFWLWVSIRLALQAGRLTHHSHCMGWLTSQNWWVTNKLLKGEKKIISMMWIQDYTTFCNSFLQVKSLKCHLFRYCPEVPGAEVRGRGACLEVIFSGQPSQPQKFTVTVKGVATKTQHQGGERRAFGLGIHWDSQEQWVRGNLLQLIGRHVEPVNWRGKEKMFRSWSVNHPMHLYIICSLNIR